MINKYNNYHSHKMYSNVKSLDVVTKPIEYIERAIELDGKQAIYFTTEHGYQGHVYEAHALCSDVCVKLTQKNKKYTKANCKDCPYKEECKGENKGIKVLVGTEAYYVHDRKEKDNSNYHLVLIARNKEGYKDINRILSYSNIDGYYYKNRIDDELLFSVNPNNVIVTSACFDKNMDVLTNDGVKKISKVKNGDYVLTIDGTYKKVNYPTNRQYQGNMYNIKGQGIFDVIRCTENHKFLTLVDNDKKWIEAKNLKIKDDLLQPIDFKIENIEKIDLYDCRNNNKNRKIKKRLKNYEVNVNSELLTLLGIYCAEGSFLYKGMGIRFTLNSEDYNIQKKVKNSMLNIFGLEPYIKNKKGKKVLEYEYGSTEIFNLFSKFFDSGAINKDIPKFIKHLDPTLQMSFIKGLYLGDGCYGERIDKRDGSLSRRISFVTISKNLAYNVIHILNRNYISPNIVISREHTDKNDVHHNEAYYLDINGKLATYIKEYIFDDKYNEFIIDKNILRKNHIPKIIDGVYYMTHRIKKIDIEENINETVYCLNVKDNHNFVLNNVLVHNCTAGRLRNDEGLDEWLINMKNYFKDNFYLEVQNHNEEVQINLNRKILRLSKEYDIDIIHGNDSHYIYPSQSKYRELFLKAKGIVYENESDFILDYPTIDVVFERYKKQGVLSDFDIHRAIANTLIFDKCESIELDKEIKMPIVSDNPNKELKEILNKEWLNIRDEIPQEKWDKYLEEIRYEFEIIEKTHMENYFIMDYKICKKAINEYGGLLTKTGRRKCSKFFY